MPTSPPSTIRYGHLSIAYDDRVLCPRPWTVLQARWAAELVGSSGDGAILELCTGAGHIGLLAAALTGRPLVAVDLDPVACGWAQHNAEAAGLGSRVTVREASLSQALEPDEVFDVAIADPPWVTSDRVADYPEDPVLAIDGGVDGLALARQCVVACRGHLSSGASLLVQVKDSAQARRLMAEALEDGWEQGELRTGLRGVVQRLVHP